MTVYVDELRDTLLPVNKQARRYGTRWCHLFADTEQELHDFARRIGLKRGYFQSGAVHRLPHYDLTPNKREQALRAGAASVLLRDWIKRNKVQAGG